MLVSKRQEITSVAEDVVKRKPFMLGWELIYTAILEDNMRFSQIGTSLVVQWLRLRALNAGGPGSIPGQGTRSHMPQLKIPHATVKIPHTATNIPCAATKTRHSQIDDR